MQKVMGYMRRAILDYNMIEEGDKIAVGISGGKDSMTLLAGLAGLRRFLGVNFSLVAITLDPGFTGVETDYTPLYEFCRSNDVELHIHYTKIGQIVFDERKEKNPCSLCSKMRRGVLHEQTKLHGCNKLALGHHKDDAIETFLMNLTIEGRIACFQPVSYLSRRDLTMIRPMVYLEEKEAKRVAINYNFPIVKSPCPIDGKTRRQTTKEFLEEQERKDKGYKDRIFNAMKKAHVSSW